MQTKSQHSNTKPITIRLLKITSLSIFLCLATGCINVSSKHTIGPILAAVKNATTNQYEPEFVKSTAPLPPNIKAEPHESLATVRQKALEIRSAKVRLDLAKAGLDKQSAINKILSSATNHQPVTISSHEMKNLANALLNKLHSGAFNGSVRTNKNWHSYSDTLRFAESGEKRAIILTGSGKPEVDVFSLLEAYYVAYSQGQFTLRDGTVLGKPTANFGITNGVLQGAIPNDTVDGIVTIFTEALCDSIFQTSLYYGITNSVTYTNEYILANTIYPNLPSQAVDAYIALSRKSTNTGKDFFLNGKTPTASKFLPCYPVVPLDGQKKKHQKGISQNEAQFIQAVCGLTAKQSQALAGLIIRSVGGTGAGQFVYLHISIGNNQVLSSIVDNLMSSFSYHLSEQMLDDVFIDYGGGDPVVDGLLEHYQDLLNIISS
jgi:hypothetical protein